MAARTVAKSSKRRRKRKTVQINVSLMMIDCFRLCDDDDDNDDEEEDDGTSGASRGSGAVFVKDYLVLKQQQHCTVGFTGNSSFFTLPFLRITAATLNWSNG